MLEKKDKLYTARVYRMWFEEDFIYTSWRRIYTGGIKTKELISLLFLPTTI